ncbi:MAG: hypothetical protein Marn2KO_36700 [Marinobacter nauticus]
MRMGRWFRAHGVAEEQWLSVISANTEGPASEWMNLQELKVMEGRRQPFRDWQAWAEEARRMFEPTTTPERARIELRGLRQHTTVKEYVKRFNSITFRIPDMSEAETFSAFTNGLKDPIRSQVVGFVRGNVREAVEMAERLDGVRGMHSAPQGRNHGPRRWNRRGGLNHIRDQEPDQVNAIGANRGRGRGGGRGRGRGGGRFGGGGRNGGGRFQGRGNTAGGRGMSCYLCGANHSIRVCPKLADAKRSVN